MVGEMNAVMRTADEKVTSFPWKRGAWRGIAAFFAGWGVVSVFSFVTPGGNSGPLVGQLTLLGLFFYNFQFVPLRTTNHFKPWLGGKVINPVAGKQFLLVPAVVYYLVPAVILLAIGGELGYRTADRENQAIHSIFCGLSLAGGYLVMAVLFAVVLGYPTNAGNIARPDLLWSVGMGIEYPLVLGSIGAYAGQWLCQA